MIIYKFIRSVLIASVIIAPTIILTDLPVVAQEVKEIGQFGDWKAYIRSDKKRTFFATLYQNQKKPASGQEGGIYF